MLRSGYSLILVFSCSGAVRLLTVAGAYRKALWRYSEPAPFAQLQEKCVALADAKAAPSRQTLILPPAKEAAHALSGKWPPHPEGQP
jgi:hypothetical protein